MIDRIGERELQTKKDEEVTVMPTILKAGNAYQHSSFSSDSSG